MSPQDHFFKACRELDYENAKLAISQGANVNLRAPFNRGDMFIYSLENNLYSALSLVAMQGLDKVSQQFLEPIDVTIEEKAIKITELLLANGADVDLLDQGDMGNSALHWAIVSHKPRLCQLLISHAQAHQKALINIPNNPQFEHQGSNPPLILALKASSRYLITHEQLDLTIPNALLDATSINVLLRDHKKNSALHWAAILRAPYDFFEALINKGARGDEVNQRQETPGKLYRLALQRRVLSMGYEKAASYSELAFHISALNDDHYAMKAINYRNYIYDPAVIELLSRYDASLNVAVANNVSTATRRPLLISSASSSSDLNPGLAGHSSARVIANPVTTQKNDTDNSPVKITKVRAVNKGQEARDFYWIDSKPLEFSNIDSNGRLVFIAKSGHQSQVDIKLFEFLVGESKISYANCQKNSRYLDAEFYGKQGFFDTTAYTKIIAFHFRDMLLSLNLEAKSSHQEFMFHYSAPDFNVTMQKLKIGENITTRDKVISYCILKGILMALDQLQENKEMISQIKYLQLSKFKDQETNTRLMQVIKQKCNNLQIRFDTLSIGPNSAPNLMVALLHPQPQYDGILAKRNPNDREPVTNSFNNRKPLEQSILDAVHEGALCFKRQPYSLFSFLSSPSQSQLLLADKFIQCTDLQILSELLQKVAEIKVGTSYQSLSSYLATALYAVIPGAIHVIEEFSSDFAGTGITANNNALFKIALETIQQCAKNTLPELPSASALSIPSV